MKKFLKVLLALFVIAAIAFTIFWFARPADISFDEVRASVPNAEYSHFADIDGVRIHYQEKGTGTPLLLLHGFTSSTYSWKDVFEPLSKTFRVIAVDFKGFGFSDKPDGDYSRSAQAALIAHLLDYLKIDRAWLCGNSAECRAHKSATCCGINSYRQRRREGARQRLTCARLSSYSGCGPCLDGAVVNLRQTRSPGFGKKFLRPIESYRGARGNLLSSAANTRRAIGRPARSYSGRPAAN